MRRYLIRQWLLLFLVFGSMVSAGGKNHQPAALRWKKFDAGLAEAKAAKKKILLDVYTDWCKWCKKLDTDVYADPKVIAYANQRYIPVKLNAESPDTVSFLGRRIPEARLAAELGVTSYPTIIFLDPAGKPIDRLNSYVDAQTFLDAMRRVDQQQTFLPIIRFIGDDAYKTMSWQEYQSSKR